MRVLIGAAVGYLALFLLVHISGKRTISQMDMWDFILLITLGSVLALTILFVSIPLVEGLIALAILIFLQFMVTLMSSRSPKIDAKIKAYPTLLFYRGKFLKNSMKSERVSESEIYAAIRSHGIGNIEEVSAVILEKTGEFSVIPNSSQGSHSSLTDVQYSSKDSHLVTHLNKICDKGDK